MITTWSRFVVVVVVLMVMAILMFLIPLFARCNARLIIELSRILNLHHHNVLGRLSLNAYFAMLFPIISNKRAAHQHA